MVAIGFLSPWEAQQPEYLPNRSTHNPKPSGCKAFYLLLKELGLNVSRWEKSIREYDEEALFIITAPKFPLTKSDVERLLSWTRKGGRLFLIDDKDNILFKEMDLKIEGSKRPYTIPAQPTVYVNGVKEIKVAKILATSRLDFVSHFKEEVLLSKNLGNGKLVVLSSPYIASNAGIKEDDNARLLTNVVLSNATSKRVLFDEYHHGYDETRSFFSYFKKTPIPWIFVQLGIAAGFLFYSLGKRFGRIIPVEDKKRRSSLEYIDSMVNIYERAELKTLVLENIYKRFRSNLCKRLGLGINTETKRISCLSKKIFKIDIQRIMERIESCIKKGKDMKDEEFIYLIKKLQVLKRGL